MAKRWSCVEPGCEWSVVAADVAEAVRAAQEHIQTAHGSFELEEMIEDVLEEVPGDDHA
jgi:predicted small metal-binding protein